MANDIYAKKRGSMESTISELISSKSFLLLSSLLMALFGASARGEGLVFIVMLWKNWEQFRFLPLSDVTPMSFSNKTQPTSTPEVEMTSLNKYLAEYNLQFALSNILISILVSYSVFIGVGGFLQWHFYIKRRDKPETWKCQPNRFLSTENERHEIILGSIALFFGSTLSGIIVTYVSNGGQFAKVYYDVTEYGWIYFVMSTMANFLFQDAISYYYHRMLHRPFFYRHFHKWHHRYHSPTAFSAVAMHPVESIVFQMLLTIPVFVMPMHYVTVASCQLYLFYFGMIDHSGIDMDSVWPWQPPVRFHDDHHRYFHVNFGFNTMVFDRFHDTIRRHNREYSEAIFGGKGRKKE